MKKNVSDVERVGRVVIGGVLSSMAFWGPKKPLYLVFLIPMIEGMIGKCLLYSAMDIDTRHEALDDKANDYFPIQSSSEQAAGHPIVGSV